MYCSFNIPLFHSIPKKTHYLKCFIEYSNNTSMIINHLFKLFFKKNRLEPNSHKKIKVTNIPFKAF